jgi:hypothetical protein
LFWQLTPVPQQSATLRHDPPGGAHAQPAAPPQAPVQHSDGLEHGPPMPRQQLDWKQTVPGQQLTGSVHVWPADRQQLPPASHCARGSQQLFASPLQLANDMPGVRVGTQQRPPGQA